MNRQEGFPRLLAPWRQAGSRLLRCDDAVAVTRRADKDGQMSRINEQCALGSQGRSSNDLTAVDARAASSLMSPKLESYLRRSTSCTKLVKMPGFAARALVVALTGLASAGLQVHAETLRTNRVHANVLFRPGFMTDGVFRNPEEAFAAVQAKFPIHTQSAEWTSTDTVGNFRMQPGVTKTNGISKKWLADVVTRSVNRLDGRVVTSSYTTMAAYAHGVVCPTSWSMKNKTVDSNNEIYICEWTLTVSDRCPNACAKGNPIFPESGLKVQTELDYASPSRLLEFVRTYRSDSGRFSSVTDARWVDYSSGANPEGCLTARYELPVLGGSPVPDNYCFRFASAGAKEYQLIDSAGRLTAFSYDTDPERPMPNSNQSVRAAKVTAADGTPVWRVSTVDNQLEWYSTTGRLIERGSVDGKRVVFSYSDSTTPADVASSAGLMIGATDWSGRKLKFAYNGAGRLVRMTDPADGVTTFTYDTASADCIRGSCDRLLAVQYPDGSQRTYHWNEAGLNGGVNRPNALTGVTDENQVRSGSYGYNANGLAASTERAGGVDRYTVTHSAGSVLVTDPLGSVTRTGTQQIQGLMYGTGDAQPAGSGSAAASSAISYDANGNVISRDDFSGNRTCYASDQARNLRTVQVEGLPTSASCAGVTAANATLPANSRKRTTEWHPQWVLPSRVAEAGRRTTSVYNGQPDPFEGGAPASCAPANALLPDGRPIAVLCRRVEQATTDANGASGFNASLQAGVPAREWKWTYNRWGQVLTEDGPRTDVADVTSYSYYTDTTADHNVGDVQSVTNAVGHVTQFTKYNAHGQLLESVNPKGVLTVHTYDQRLRLTSTTVGGRTTSYSYEPTGDLKRVTQPDGSWIENSYDDARRLVAVNDSRGNQIAYTLDNAGNRLQESIKDPNGALQRSITRSFDALRRVQQSNER